MGRPFLLRLSPPPLSPPPPNTPPEPEESSTPTTLLRRLFRSYSYDSPELTTRRNGQTEQQPQTVLQSPTRHGRTERLMRPATTSDSTSSTSSSSSTQTVNNATITTTITTTNTTDDIEDEDEDYVDYAREIETSLVGVVANSDDLIVGPSIVISNSSRNVPVLNGLACIHCGAHLAHLTRENLVSNSFTGRSGPAMLLTNVINTNLGHVETRQLMTGEHTVADTFCTCGLQIGWYYLDAKNVDQKYKIGKSVIENSKSIKITLV
jgi:hypothetical protein